MSTEGHASATRDATPAPAGTSVRTGCQSLLEGRKGGRARACVQPGEDSEQFQTCCKIGTGFSEENLKEFHARLSQHTLDGKRSWYDVTDTFKPDVWLDATETWEVRAADLSISPAHTGAMDRVKAGKGIALRFPRFLRVRDDKAPQQCTSSVEIGELYQAQASVA